MVTTSKGPEPLKWPLSREEFMAHYDHPFLLVEYGAAPETEFETVMDLDPRQMMQAGQSTDIFPLRKRPGAPFSFITVGRATNNDIVLKVPSLSKCHVAFHARSGSYQVVDMGSKNGTKLNARTLAPKQQVEIKNDDLLTLSQVVRIVFLEAERAYTWLAAHR